MARLAPGGKRYAMANRTEGSSYEAPTRWVADIAIPVEPASHAVQRSRDICATALDYAMPQRLHYGLGAAGAGRERCVVLIHGTSRADKLWPEPNWVELGQRLLAQGWASRCRTAAPRNSNAASASAQALGPRAEVWPRLSLDALADRMGHLRRRDRRRQRPEPHRRGAGPAARADLQLRHRLAHRAHRQRRASSVSSQPAHLGGRRVGCLAPYA